MLPPYGLRGGWGVGGTNIKKNMDAEPHSKQRRTTKRSKADESESEESSSAPDSGVGTYLSGTARAVPLLKVGRLVMHFAVPLLRGLFAKVKRQTTQHNKNTKDNTTETLKNTK